MATLGSKSNLKKISRRAILDVDLQKACKTITEPQEPLALRLQGSLLFGVSRVFQQQCGYVLTDATSLRDKMRDTEHVLKKMELDPDVGKTRPEQLNLPEDPYFVPELDIHFDLSVFGLGAEGGSSSSSVSSFLTVPSSQTSHAPHDELDFSDLGLLSFDSPAGDTGGFNVSLGGETSSVAQTVSRVGPYAVSEEEPAIMEVPFFDVDEDGFLQPVNSGSPLGFQLPSDAGPPPQSEARASDWGGGARLSSGRDDEPMSNFDDMIALEEGEPTLLPAAPQIPLTPEAADEEVQPATRQTSSAQPSEESSETAEAPERRARTVKVIRPDRETELSNRDLNDWNQNYLANMAAASRIRQSRLARLEAKTNAEFWFLQQGLGNVASLFGEDRVPHPFTVFSGQSLWDMLSGGLEYGRKRSRSSSLADVEQDDDRRVRARTTSEGEVARGVGDERLPYPDDDGLLFQSEDFDVEVEVGRQGAPSLLDQLSNLPWNLSGSRQSSAQPPGSGLISRLTSSIGGPYGGIELGPPSVRGRRLTSASPLFGRGLASLSRRNSQGPFDASRVTSNEDDFADLDAQLGADIDPEFELYGPSVNVDTQTAAQSQWVATTLENEAYNFLSFVNTKIQEKAEQQDVTGEEGTAGQATTITLDELLPPTQNSQIVGAQALLHVLALATKGLLEVYQAEGFTAIEISVVSH
ncbi:hypothetical protein AYL99_08860 [Fonsecaea erecta]|uniref:Rad21/Rec8-like protein N-terminal domain-containing protein n=1 Tax=Fonsecaea erecta TaxID=1367422 RepID=A0A178ZAE6_9EURO|nr:hypothetical protein AYL99_08860 [Fonsecaea erecta]OAP56748.1 hypothetical protein AYL99_08860 [Fonsecaea erecta]